MRSTATAIALTLFATAAAAQGAGSGQGGLAFTLGAGIEAQPEYFGADDYQAAPSFSFSPRAARLPSGAGFGNPDFGVPDYGLGLRGSLRYIPERDGDDELAGLDDVDATFELGGGIAYTQPNFEAFADLRYGAVGHNSFVGELGADLVARPTDRLTLSAGPRVLLGDDDYADTYYGVNGDEAAASGLDAYSADGGVLRTGVELGATYQLSDRWGVEGAISYDRLSGDAADSPITDTGSRDQYRARIGLTRRFTLGF